MVMELVFRKVSGLIANKCYSSIKNVNVCFFVEIAADLIQQMPAGVCWRALIVKSSAKILVNIGHLNTFTSWPSSRAEALR